MAAYHVESPGTSPQELALTRRRFLGTAGKSVLVMCGATLLAACGTPTPAATPPKPASGTTAAAPAAAAPTTAPAAPQRGGTFVVAVEDAPPGLSGTVFSGFATAVVGGNLYTRLVKFDLQNKIVPELAETLDKSPDGKQYTFRLRQNAKYHDGTPITADDIVWNYTDVWSQTPTGLTTLAPNVESVTAADKFTVVFKLKDTYAPLLAGLYSNDVLPMHIYKGTKLADFPQHPDTSKPIGSGPFKFEEWVKGSHVALARFADWYAPGKPLLDRIVFQTVPDQNSIVTAFEKGELDFLHLYIVPYDRVATYRKDPRFTVFDGGANVGALNLLQMNMVENQFLKNKQVRQAIAYGINRDELNDKALFGLGKVSHGIVGSDMPDFFEGKYDVYKYNAAQAERLLDEAGATKDAAGKRFALRLDIQAGRPFDQRTAEIIKSNLAPLGIDVTIIGSDRAAFDDKTSIKRNFDMAIKLWATGPDPDVSTSRTFLKSNIGKLNLNRMGYDKPELEKLFADAPRQADPAQRKEKWAEAARLVMDDVPQIGLYEMPNIQLISGKFCDVVTNGPWGYNSQARTDAWMCK